MKAAESFWIWCGFLIVLALMAHGCRQAGVPEQHGAGTDPGTVYFNALVLTLDPGRPRASGLRVAGGRITHVFDGAPPGSLTGRRVDLGGAAVLPGLSDGHFHLQSFGSLARQLDLRGSSSAEEIANRVRAAAGRIPRGSWIRGRGWDQNDWLGKRFPDNTVLDAVTPNHPVWLTRVDGHAVWLNARALAAAGIDQKTEDPPGGEIVRDASGRTTGVLVDNAISLAEVALPAPSLEEVQSDVERGLSSCREAGLTGLHLMDVGAQALAALESLEREGRLCLRITAYLDAADQGNAARLEAGPNREGLLRVVGVKLYADGALGSRGAALLAPYSDRQESSGLLLTPPDELARRVKRFHQAGFQVAIHAIGDRGVRVALDAVESGQSEDGSRRHRIEHVQVLHPGDLPRFKALGVVASMQPTHAVSDMPWAEDRLGSARIRNAYAWSTVLKSGAPLAFGSDAPVESHDPLAGIQAAVTRQDPSGKPPGGWYPAQRLSVEQALAAFTKGCAFAARLDDLGVIRPGSIADLTVVDQDPGAVEPRALLGIRVLRTIVAGSEVFVAQEGDSRGR